MASVEEQLYALWGEVQDLDTASEILGWDQETFMPSAGVEGRGKILATLAGTRHEKLTAPALREVLEACAEAAEPGSVLAAQVRCARRVVDRAVKVPGSLTRELAETQSQALAAWQQARKAADFSHFQPYLERLLHLKRQEARAVTGDSSPGDGALYDALLDEYEPGATTAALVPLFESLKAALSPLVQGVVESGVTVDESAAQGAFPAAQQEAFGRRMAEAFGFDFAAGRMDLSTHPFCTGFNPRDVRLTWRYQEDDLRPALFGILHETGHGLYEQGLPASGHRTPAGGAVSLGIHESQSRLWENLVARSRPFWHWALPQMQEMIPSTQGATVDTLWPALHTVRPSLVRVEADEATYNLHVAIRFDLERALFAGDLEVADLPTAWDAAYGDLLGITAETAADGVLQDIHWSMGAFGYFPTYTLGTLAASQLMAAAERDLGDQDEAFARGELKPLLDWLRRHIHQHGSRYEASDLLVKATGKLLAADDFLAYIRTTTEAVYGVSVAPAES